MSLLGDWDYRAFDLDGSGARAGDRQGLDSVFSATYEELRRLASRVRGDDPGATLNPTALVNEAWAKLAGAPNFQSTSLLHFKRIAARAMREVLVDSARRRKALKRGGSSGVRVVPIDDARDILARCDDELVALDDALRELARIAPRQALIVESRFFGGLDIGETAALLEVSEATVARDWRATKAWLASELRQPS